ncbi:MAG: hypothetical protein Fur0028_09820 [Bacteroidales bacterium]
MRKNFTLLLMLFLTTSLLSSLFSQTLELQTTGGSPLQYGDTITVSGTPQSSELIGYLHVKNISSSSVSVTCTKTYIYIVPGSSNTFCWANNCYPPSTFTSTSSKTLAPLEVATDFSGDYYPSGNAGISYIRYTFNVYHGDSAWIIIKFDATGAGINSNNMAKLSKPYPNPATTQINIPYQLSFNQKGTIEIFDIIGKSKGIFTLNPKSNFQTLLLEDYNNGIYFIQLKANGKVVGTEKIIVKH